MSTRETNNMNSGVDKQNTEQTATPFAAKNRSAVRLMMVKNGLFYVDFITKANEASFKSQPNSNSSATRGFGVAWCEQAFCEPANQVKILF